MGLSASGPPKTPQQPPDGGLADFDKDALRCNMCGSRDVWRARKQSFWVRWFLNLSRKKAFQCRQCRNRFYRKARRKQVSLRTLVFNAALLRTPPDSK